MRSNYMSQMHNSRFIGTHSFSAILDHFCSEIEMPEKISLSRVFTRAKLACRHFAKLTYVMQNYSGFYHLLVGVLISLARRFRRNKHSVNMIKKSAANIMMHSLCRRPYKKLFLIFLVKLCSNVAKRFIAE